MNHIRVWKGSGATSTGVQSNVVYKTRFLGEARIMVEFVRISKDGIILEIKEVSDAYRDKQYEWDEEK